MGGLIFGLGQTELIVFAIIVSVLLYAHQITEYLNLNKFCFNCFHFSGRDKNRCRHCGTPRR